ncbi:hypothetical protein CYMTET_40702 [Cymbomonas tetramitiformis]|uniref:Uncharacterized protein n=1 Tax=Cymbomonas tetramitiformis TaxID=36881 RepID=A0AAE0F2Q8_9CHLO|nr:hypothetical protein CYMTET_40702 [Cymbomonas tetramitiformis]
MSQLSSPPLLAAKQTAARHALLRLTRPRNGRKASRLSLRTQSDLAFSVRQANTSVELRGAAALRASSFYDDALKDKSDYTSAVNAILRPEEY